MLWTSLCVVPTFLSVGALVSLMKAQCFASGENKHFGEQEQLACNMTPAASRKGEFSQLQPFLAAAAAKSLQSCPTLCDTIDGSPPGSPVPGILQARTLEWLAISFSNAWKGKVKVKSLSRVRLSVTLWTAAHQAPPSMGFSRQEYWNGVPLPSPQPFLRGRNIF